MRSLRSLPWVASIVVVACGPAIEPSGDSEGGDGGGTSSDGDTDTGADTAPQSDPDGDCMSVIGTDPEGAATPQTAGGWAYWSTLSGAIVRSPLDVPAPEMLTTAPDVYVDVAVAGDSLLYAAADQVGRIDLATGGSEVLAAGQNNPIRPRAIGSRIYWINAGSGILAADLMRLDAGATEPTQLLDWFGFPMGAGADEHAYYLVAKDYSDEGDHLEGAVLRIDDGTGATTVLASPIPQPSGLAVTDDRVFWIEQVDDRFNRPGRVRSVAKTGGEVIEHATIDTGLGVTVAADARDVFFSVFDSEVTQLHRIDRSTGAQQLIADFPGSTVIDMALADDAVVVTTAWSEGMVAAGTPSVTRLCRD